MRILTSFILSLAMIFCTSTVVTASDAVWQPIRERQDFKVDDRTAIIEGAFEELRSVYGHDLDVEELRKGNSYVHSIHSDEFKKDVIVVMIEDREQQDTDSYYKIIFALPDMNSVYVGGIWLDTPIAEYLDAIPAQVYGEDGFLSEEMGGIE